MNIVPFLFAILAGGLGAGLRVAVTRILPTQTTGFPLAILLVNVVGSFLIGMTAALAANSVLSEDVSFVLAVGFCGGFTTMSTFAVESIERLRAGLWLIAGLNIVGSTALGLLAVGAGYLLAGGPVS
ncbi:CrcB protein [Aurantimicrobium minutum]|uniref:fluoride efflux transporter FluC n=1 Tax=Aurantimicrobium minutum TaxID=708131 RepID=UPI002474A2EF|nr:CrcB family protein [Aurantimicrobium minutum]MDH6532215.1 CrcB protein [Aurantimicrobium minutum]